MLKTENTLSGNLEPLVRKIVVLKSFISIFILGQVLKFQRDRSTWKVTEQKPFYLQIGDYKDVSNDNDRPIT